MRNFRTLAFTILAALACTSAYGGEFENDRVTSGIKFKESEITEEAPPVQLNGEFRPVQRASLTADIRRNAATVNVPLPEKVQNPDQKPPWYKKYLTKENIETAIKATWIGGVATVVCLGLGGAAIAAFVVGMAARGIYLGCNYLYKKWGPAAA